MEKIITLVFGIICLIFASNLYYTTTKYRKIKKIAREQRKKENDYKYGTLIPYFIHQLELAKDLNDIFILHLKIWGSGIRNRNIGPDSYGTFRTDDIMTMNPEDVYLYLPEISFTKRLTDFKKEDEYIYNLGLKRYKHQLISNLKAIKDKHGERK